MCLVIETIYHERETNNGSYLLGKFIPLTAEEDIKVYKVLRYEKEYEGVEGILQPITPTWVLPMTKEHYSTPFMNASVKFKKGWATMESVLDISDGNRIEQGIHAYRNVKFATSAVGNGHGGLVVRTAYIPKGTPFYVGTNGDIVSSKLIISEVGNDITFNGMLDFHDWYFRKESQYEMNKEKMLKDEYPTKKAYDMGFEAGKRLRYAPDADEIDALEGAVKKLIGKDEAYHLARLLNELREL